MKDSDSDSDLDSDLSQSLSNFKDLDSSLRVFALGLGLESESS